MTTTELGGSRSSAKGLCLPHRKEGSKDRGAFESLQTELSCIISRILLASQPTVKELSL
jgi:hypothetical protein